MSKLFGVSRCGTAAIMPGSACRARCGWVGPDERRDDEIQVCKVESKSGSLAGSPAYDRQWISDSECGRPAFPSHDSVMPP